MTGREIAHHRRTGDHEVCESLESLLTDSQSWFCSVVGIASRPETGLLPRKQLREAVG